LNSWQIESAPIDISASRRGYLAAFACAGSEIGVLDFTSLQLRWLRTESWVRVTSVILSDDDSSVIAGCNNGLIAILDLTTGQPSQIMHKHSDVVTTLALSEDGFLLASGSKDRRVILWDLRTGESSRILEGHSDVVSSVVFSGDSLQLFSAAYDETIRVWSVGTGALIRTLRGHGDRIQCLALSSDKEHLVSGGWDRTVTLWDLDRVIHQPAANEKWQHSDLISTAVASKNGQQLISGSWDHTLIAWNTPLCRSLQAFRGHNDKVNTVAVSPDSQAVASGGRDGAVILWDLKTGKRLKSPTMNGYQGWINSVTFSNNGALLFSGSEFGTLHVWAMADLKISETIPVDMDGIRAIAIAPDDRHLVVGGFGKEIIERGEIKDREGLLRLVNLETGNVINLPTDHTATVSAVDFAPDRSWFVSVAWDGKVIKWNLNPLEPLLQWQADPAPLYVVAVSPDAQWIFSGGRDKVLKVWDAGTGENVGRYYCRGEVRACSVWTAAGTLFGAVGDSVGTVAFFQLHGATAFPDILTAYQGANSNSFLCPRCLTAASIAESNLGSEVDCLNRNCGSRFKLNPFLGKGDPTAGQNPSRVSKRWWKFLRMGK
jgi:WD40 repeat protein